MSYPVPVTGLVCFPIPNLVSFQKISSGNRCSNPLHNKWGNNDKKLKMASKLSNAVITIFRHLGYERSSGCMFCETCVSKATEVAEMDKSQGTSAIMVSQDSDRLLTPPH